MVVEGYRKYKGSFPDGYFALFCSEFAARFCFWAVQSILVIYLTKQYSTSDSEAYTICATYGTLTYAATLFGGLLADKRYGTLRILLSGMLLSVIGMFLLFLNNTQFCYYGLALLIVGMGINMPANTSLLDNLYEKNDPLRDRGYFYLYIATNIGAILGPICFGIISQYYSFASGFLACGLMLIVSLIFYYFSHVKLYHLDSASGKKLTIKQTIRFLGILFFMVFITFKLIHAGRVNVYLLGGIFISALVLLLIYSGQLETRSVKKSINLILFFSFISVFFFGMELQLLNSFVTFTRDYVNNKILFFSIPPSSFVSFQPFFVVILAPIVNSALEKRKPKANSINIIQFSFSFLSLSLGFLILSIAAQYFYNTNQLISPVWLILSTFFMSLGEVCLMPALLSLITKDTPENLKNFMVGFLYFCLSLASYISGKIAHLVNTSKITIPVLGYQATYLKVFIFSLGISGILWLLRRVINNGYENEFK